MTKATTGEIIVVLVVSSISLPCLPPQFFEYFINAKADNKPVDNLLPRHQGFHKVK